jgi:SAM-dependent methyltransferase
MLPADPTTRFTGLSDVYAKHRPPYPEALFRYLLDSGVVKKGDWVADVGAGTGIFSKGLLDIGAKVYAIEPNREMRECALREFGPNPAYHGVAGRAEATTLPDRSVDAVTAAQAFHWFDLTPTRAEFARMLKPHGEVCIVYNERDMDDAFSTEYQEMVSSYSNLDQDTLAKERNPRVLFGEAGCTRATFPNRQTHNKEGLLGRVFSSSYMPKRGEEGHEAVYSRVCDLFERHQRDGRVCICYTTVAYHGALE